MNIYCGQNVLDYGGYMYRFKDTPKTIFEAMQEHGFKTFYNSYQPQCHPSSVRRGVDDLYYNVGSDHELFHIHAYVQDNKIRDREAMAGVQAAMSGLIRRIGKMDRRLNVKNAMGRLCRTVQPVPCCRLNTAAVAART